MIGAKEWEENHDDYDELYYNLYHYHVSILIILPIKGQYYKQLNVLWNY